MIYSKFFSEKFINTVMKNDGMAQEFARFVFLISKDKELKNDSQFVLSAYYRILRSKK